MSYMARLRKKWDYEKDVPRCESCTYFREAYIKLTQNSMTRRVHHHCGLGGFNCSKVGLCSKWQSKSGETLE